MLLLSARGMLATTCGLVALSKLSEEGALMRSFKFYMRKLSLILGAALWALAVMVFAYTGLVFIEIDGSWFNDVIGYLMITLSLLLTTLLFLIAYEGSK